LTDLTAAFVPLAYGKGGVMAVADTRHREALVWPHVSDWLGALIFEGKRPRTLYAYERGIAPLLREYPVTELREFTHQMIVWELGRVPQRSRYISRSIYNQFFDWAYRDERIDRNPMGRVPKLKAGPKRPTDRFTAEEVAQLEALPAPHGQLFAILFGTGIRRAEARHLRRSAIDLNRMRLMVIDGKGGKDAVLPLSPELATAVESLDLLERLEPSDHLWFRPRYPVGDPRRRSDPIGSETFAKWYRHWLGEARVRYLSPHKTRHTFHWLLRQEGYDLEERQLMLRHESPETTVRLYPAVDIDDVARKRSRIAT
jgi:integrase